MWYELRRQQHRAYWRTPDGRDYEPFPTEEAARAFIALCKQFGRDRVVAAHRARPRDTTPMPAGPAPTPAGDSTAIAGTPGATAAPGATGAPEGTAGVPALAAGLTAPSPVGITLAWLGEQYVASGHKGNANTASDYRRDLARYVFPYFRRQTPGDLDIAMIMTRPLPTQDGADWPWPTVAGWKKWLAQQPRHQVGGVGARADPVPGNVGGSRVGRHRRRGVCGAVP